MYKHCPSSQHRVISLLLINTEPENFFFNSLVQFELSGTAIS